MACMSRPAKLPKPPSIARNELVLSITRAHSGLMSSQTLIRVEWIFKGAMNLRFTCFNNGPQYTTGSKRNFEKGRAESERSLEKGATSCTRSLRGPAERGVHRAGEHAAGETQGPAS